MSLRTRSFTCLASAAFAAALLAGCVQPPIYQEQAGYSPAYPSAPPPAYPAYPSYGGQAYRPAPPAYAAEYGRVANIEVLQHEERRAPSGAGAVIGGVLGAIVGNQVGKGMGRAAATGVGVLGGAVAGNALEGNQRGPTVQSYRVSVQTDRGRMEVFDVPNPGDLRIGDRVRVENGRIQRI